MTQPTSEALSDNPFPDSAVFEKVEEDHGATPTYMIVVRESWRESILCEGMYGWAADWLVKQLNDLEGVRKDRLVGLAEAVTSRTFAAMQESLDQALARCEAAEKRVEELTHSDDGESESCGICGRGYLLWHAPQSLWDELIGHYHGTRCPRCFTDLAHAAGMQVHQSVACWFATSPVPTSGDWVNLDPVE